MKKILISCNANGNIEFVINKATLLSQKTAFDFLIMIGNVFTPSSSTYIHKIIKKQVILPFPVYIIDNSPIGQIMGSLFPDGHQICPELEPNQNGMYFLGKYGVKEIQGLSIAYLNDQEMGDNIDEFISNVNALKQVIYTFSRPIDILLTHDEPCQIALSSPDAITRSSAYLGEMIIQCAPKYHIAAGRKEFYRMDPYRNRRGSYTHFINIAQIKELPPCGKYLYAIQTIPLKDAIQQQQPTCIPNPFTTAKEKQQSDHHPSKTVSKEQPKPARYLSKEERMKKEEQEGNKQPQTITKQSYIYFEGFPMNARQSDITEFMERWGDILTIQIFNNKNKHIKHQSGLIHYRHVSSTTACLADSNQVTFQHNRIKFKHRQIFNRHRDTECWFCISTPNFNHDLLLFKGKYCYIAMEKGPLTACHLQIIPYNHIDRLSRLEEGERNQINQIRDKLSKYYTSINQCPISYQRCIRLSSEISHCIINVLPVPLPFSHPQHKFNTINKSDNLSFKKIEQGRDIEIEHQRREEHFIHLQIGQDHYMREIYRNEKLPIDYVRKIMAELIGDPRIVNWKNCIRSQQQFNTDKAQCMSILHKCDIV